MDRAPAVPDRIVVPIDDSADSRRALPLAQALADAFECDLRTITVADPAAATDADIVLDGDPIDALRQATAATPSAVLCMASHGRSNIGRRLLGSTTEQLLRTAFAPVVVVGPDVPQAAMAAPRTIVAGIAWPPRPDRLIELLEQWAPALGAQVDLVHARSPWPAELYVEQVTGRRAPDQPDLDALADRLRSGHIQVTTHAMTGTDPVAALTRVAEQVTQPAMIAVETHRGAADGDQDVAYQLIRHVPFPVLATTGQPLDR